MSEPYYDLNGNLVIPMDAPLACRWWEAATGGRYDYPHPENMEDVGRVEKAFELARRMADGTA